MAKVTKAQSFMFKLVKIEIPEGLSVSLIEYTKDGKEYFLDEFPKDIFPPGSTLRQDAIYYGIRLKESQVMDKL